MGKERLALDEYLHVDVVVGVARGVDGIWSGLAGLRCLGTQSQWREGFPDTEELMDCEILNGEE